MSEDLQKSLDTERLGLPSASKLERVCECPGSENLLKSIGTAAALAIEEVDPLAETGIKIHKARQTGNTLDLSTEELESYQAGLKCEARILEKWKEAFSLGDIIEGPREFRLYMHDHNMDPVASGQLDTHFLSGTRAAILDWKTGFCSNLVGARGNWQLRMQAVLLKIEHEHLTDIRVSFVKPKFQYADLDYVDYSETDLKFAADSVRYHLWMSTQPDAFRRPGLHCTHCPCKAWCPEALAYALLPSTIAKVFNPKHIAERVNSVTGDDLYRIWESGPVIRKILDAVTNRLKTFDTDQLFVLNLERGKGRENNPITAVKECFFWLRDTLGWDEDRVWGCLEFINGKIAEVAKLRGGLEEKEAKEWVKTNLGQFITVNLSDQPLRKRK